ncbi:MAG: CocE/NonD family hydrolase [Clostridiales bacterium]|nr:CocE/NonD family hydrolase [Clostridiales bacterium]
MAENEVIRKKRIIDGEEIEVIYQKLRQRPAPGEAAARALAEGRRPVYMRDGFGDFPELDQRTYEVCPGIICEQDVMIPMRDGTKTYCDIFRPAGQANVPVIISYSFYGKRACVDNPDVEYGAFGVPEGSFSKNAKFEGPDPEYWCHHGYAVANYDQRGVNNSEGDIALSSSFEGEDAYDLVEFLAGLEWCNGKVGFSGNSGLAVIQWKAASERPPHLACIAPWEGTMDNYRQMLSVGGISECGFNPYLFGMMYGQGYMEDHYKMVLERPLYDAYWADKVAKIENIDVPAYITGGWNHFHLYGAVEGFSGISSKEKWLRIHREFEWPDYYMRENLEDLKMFFDRYLKGVRNGWESTPRVRIDVMDAYDRDHEIRRPAADFPLPGTVYKKLWLDASDGSMKAEPPAGDAKVSYNADIGPAAFEPRADGAFNMHRESPPAGDDRAVFDFCVPYETEIIGNMRLRLWAEADGNDDMDLFVAVKKMDADGKWLPVFVQGAPHPGAPGRLRVSLRELDEEKSTECRPFHKLNDPQKLADGEIVPVDIDIWPTARIWHAGEVIRVEVMGYYERFDWYEPFDFNTINKGRHIIHTGGNYDSWLQIPETPEAEL